MEYCTCKKRIKDCEFWKNIYLNFHQNEIGDFNKFKIMFESNFKFQNLILKKHKSDKYLSLLINLYSLIYKISDSKVIIDSSKHISRSFILNRYFDLHIIFIKRSFSGILNSSKKSARKNLKKGYEHSIKPKSSIKMFFIYIFNNLINSILINFFKKQLHN